MVSSPSAIRQWTFRYNTASDGEVIAHSIARGRKSPSVRESKFPLFEPAEKAAAVTGEGKIAIAVPVHVPPSHFAAVARLAGRNPSLLVAPNACSFQRTSPTSFAHSYQRNRCLPSRLSTPPTIRSSSPSLSTSTRSQLCPPATSFLFGDVELVQRVPTVRSLIPAEVACLIAFTRTDEIDVSVLVEVASEGFGEVGVDHEVSSPWQTNILAAIRGVRAN